MARLYTVVDGNGSWDIETVDSTHLRYRFRGTDKWAPALHVMQVTPRWVQQLQTLGAMDERKYMTEEVE